ncbi:HD domain-containing protein [candidate division KSB1 bacterium]|nr:HD domain-containing protein [candidate division KSB1 bacterium]
MFWNKNKHQSRCIRNNDPELSGNKSGLVPSADEQHDSAQDRLLEHAVSMLARSAEIFDTDTGDHIKRIDYYSRQFAALLGADQRYQRTIGIQSQLHDVGKIHVDSRLLNKPHRLTNDEFDAIKQHAVNGGRIIGERNSDFALAHQIALYHHEKWDGSGYPYGLKGWEIPIAARIVSILDVFDALISARSYKPAFSAQKTYRIMKRGDASRNFVPENAFDPYLLDMFLTNYDLFVGIYEENKKTEQVVCSQDMETVVLDDDPHTRIEITRMLSQIERVNVQTFHDIESMKRTLTRTNQYPYLFFVDIHYLNKTDHDIARQIKSQYPNAYLVCLTRTENINHDRLSLYDRIFRKPIELSNLVEITETVIRYYFRPSIARDMQNKLTPQLGEYVPLPATANK